MELQARANKTLNELINIELFKDIREWKCVCNTHGIYCPKCGSSDVHEIIEQLRCGDEESDHLYYCLKCEHRGKNNFLCSEYK